MDNLYKFASRIIIKLSMYGFYSKLTQTPDETLMITISKNNKDIKLFNLEVDDIYDYRDNVITFSDNIFSYRLIYNTNNDNTEIEEM